MRKFILTSRVVFIVVGCLVFGIGGFLFAENNKKADSSSKHLPYSPSELLIQFKSKLKLPASTLTNSNAPTGSSALDSLNTIFHVRKIIPLFPAEKKDVQENKHSEISQTYLFKFDTTFTISKLKKSYQSLNIIDLVEFNHYYLADHSDKKILSSINKLQIEEAVSYINPSHSIIIGIIDTGIDWEQKHLISNIWKNPLEKLDGKDNDNNGLIDDLWGWNFVNPDLRRQFSSKWDNMPFDDSGHGTQIAEIINRISNYRPSNIKDNSKNRLMILKAGTQSLDGKIIFTAFSISQAILYAVKHGAKIINLSLGGESPSHVLQQSIDYAVRNGCSIIASAGNDGSNKLHYPAAYENVWAVAATDENDYKLQASNYGPWIDIAAPGVSPELFSFSDSTEWGISGTSIAASHVSGLAGLLLSCEDIMDCDSLKRRIIWSSENIYHKNPEYSGQLGAGRINALRAFNAQHQPNIIIQKISIDLRKRTQYLLPVNIVPVIISIKNLSSKAENLNLKLTTDDPYLTTLQSEVLLQELDYQQEYSNKQNPFTLTINDNYPTEHQAILTVNIVTSNAFSMTKDFSLPIRINTPKGLSIINHNPVTLKWAGDSEFTGYHIYRRTNNQQTFLKISEIPIIDSTYVDYATASSYQYFYYVTGIDTGDWESPASEIVAIKLIDLSPGLSIKSVFPQSDTALTFSDSLQFHISMQNEREDTVQFQWLVNDEIQHEKKDSIFVLFTDSLFKGDNTIKVMVSCPDTAIWHVWNVRISQSSSGVDQIIFSPVTDTTITTFFPETDMTIYEGDTLNLFVQIPPQTDSLKNFQWSINSKIDSAAQQTNYVVKSDYFSAGVDTIVLNYDLGDSTLSHQWLITILNRNRPPEILSFTLPLDTTITTDDTLLFFVKAMDPDQDSLVYRWYINKQLDSTTIDTVYTLFRLDREWKIDTVFVQISDNDTSVYHYWTIHSAQNINQIPQIVSYFPPTDSMLTKADSIQFQVHCEDPDGDSLQFAWFINNYPDTSAHDSTYFYRYVDSTSTYDTLMVVIADADTSVKLEWILWAEGIKQEQPSLRLLSWYPEQDSLIAEGDSLLLWVKNANDSCQFQWTINGRVDSTVHDSTLIYYFIQESGLIDTIQVTVFDRDTLLSHKWYIYYLDLPQKMVPIRLVFKPEEEIIHSTTEDSLKFSVTIIEGAYSELNFLWLINSKPDTTVQDTTFYYSPNFSFTKPDTIMLIVSDSDTTFLHRWIVYVNQQLMLPAPHLIFPIEGNEVSEEDLLIWEYDSSLAQIDSIGPWTGVVQLSYDTTFVDPISSDSCNTTNTALNKLSRFDRILIGKPIYWRVKIFSGFDKVSEFKKCDLPFQYYPLFARLENFYGQKNEDGSIDLLWTTSYEKNCAGFNVYRSEIQEDNFKKINEHLITGQKNYSFQDVSTETGKTYYYKLEDVSSNGVKKFHQTISVTAPTPNKYSLSQNYPNPFNSKTSFKYQIPVATHVTIAVYNVLGRKVKTLVDERKEPGFYTVYWDGIDDQGKNVVSGVYFYYMSANNFNMTHKMLVVR